MSRILHFWGCFIENTPIYHVYNKTFEYFYRSIESFLETFGLKKMNVLYNFIILKYIFGRYYCIVLSEWSWKLYMCTSRLLHHQFYSWVLYLYCNMSYSMKNWNNFPQVYLSYGGGNNGIDIALMDSCVKLTLLCYLQCLYYIYLHFELGSLVIRELLLPFIIVLRYLLTHPGPTDAHEHI